METTGIKYNKITSVQYLTDGIRIVKVKSTYEAPFQPE